MKNKFIIVLSLTFSMGCKSNSQFDNQEKLDTAGILEYNLKKRIPLYSVDTNFLPYLPDTSLRFNNPEELKQYFFITLRKFKDFCSRVKDTSRNKDSAILSTRQAEILYQDLTEVNYMKFYKKWKKDNLNMSMLSSFSPTSRIISLDERIDFFKTFPEEIQKNEVGRKTWTRFQEYSFDKNIGLNIHEFDNFKIITPLNDIMTFKNIFQKKYKYYVMVFGASWCLPCRLEEKQLKYWNYAIDTSQIKIIGLSIDRDHVKWEKYLKEEELPWECFLINGEMDNPMITKLGFQGIPRNFLLDSTGKILAENTDIRKILKAIPIVETE